MKMLVDVEAGDKSGLGTCYLGKTTKILLLLTNSILTLSTLFGFVGFHYDFYD